MLGIDASLSSTGFAYQGSKGLVTGRVTTDKLRGMHRLVYLRNQITKVLDEAKPTLVVYEDYAMSKRANNAFHLGELGGVLKTLIWERGIDAILVPPTVLKKIITGKGNADQGKAGRLKPEMRKALREHFTYDIAQNDEADAAALMVVGEIARGVRKAPEVAAKSKRFEVVSQLQITRGKCNQFQFPLAEVALRGQSG